MRRDTDCKKKAHLEAMNGEFKKKTNKMENIKTKIKMMLVENMKKNTKLYLKLKPKTKA